MLKLLKLSTFAILLGLLNSIIFVIFEWIVNDWTEYIWNDLFNTDEKRFLLIPLAILLSIFLSSIIRILNQNRIGEVEANFLDTSAMKNIKSNDLIKIFIIGAVSLVAGASLGPEASLVGIAAGMGILFAKKSKENKNINLLSISSVGALLVAFFGSLIPILIPLLAVFKNDKKIIPLHLITPIITGTSAYIILLMIKGGDIGFTPITISNQVNLKDIFAAFFLGIVGAIISISLKEMILKTNNITQKINSKMNWIISASILGAVIGILYLIGGESVQFSGKQGIGILLENQNSLTLISILIIIFIKLIVTGWSLSSGYRGGLVFPSVFMGVAVSILFTAVHPSLGGAGVAVGTISGIMGIIISPLIAFILVISMIPFELLSVAIAGLVGAALGKKIVNKIKMFKKAKQVK